MSRRAVGFIILIAAASFAAVKAPSRQIDPVRLIRSAYSEGTSAVYTGTLKTSVYYMGHERATTATIVHKGNSERLAYKTGVIVVSGPKETRTYMPSDKKVLVSCSQGQKPGTSRLDLLLKNYRPVVSGTERVAGRDTVIVTLSPIRAGNPFKKLWIDRSTAAILKTEDISSSGKLRSSSVFTSVDYKSKLPNNAFGVPSIVNASWQTVRESGRMDRASAEKATGIRMATPKYVPVGYVADCIGVFQCPCNCTHKALRIRYTNGLNSISVYEMPKTTQCGSGTTRMNCPSAGSCVVRSSGQSQVATTSKGKTNIIVVSDLPEKEIAKIAGSI